MAILSKVIHTFIKDVICKLNIYYTYKLLVVYTFNILTVYK